MRSAVWKVTTITLVGLVIVVLVTAGSALAYRAYRQHRNADVFAIRSPQGISDGRFVKIGGIDQWVQVRGDDVGNPILLVLHGGPGSSYIPATCVFLPWEKYFTVVQWDQRGTGRTFGRNGEKGSGEMSVDRMAKDGIEVIDYARQRLHQERVILYGTSWGTILGTTIAQRRPELLSAYVGSGQVVDMVTGESIGYEALQRTVAQKGDQKAIAAFSAITPPPYKDVRTLGSERQLFWRYAPATEDAFRKRILANVLFSPGYSLKDMLDYDAGSAFSIGALFKTMTTADLRPLGTAFRVPVIFIQGTEDTLTPTTLVKDYFDSISAPRKEFVLIPNAGHLVSLALSDEVLAAFLVKVRPLALGTPEQQGGLPKRLPSQSCH
jgi:pimeloyl-ACP methyl ester carboxylesterase